MKRLLTLCLAALTLISLLASCSDGLSSSEDTTAPAITGQDTEPLPEGIILAGPGQPTVATIVYPAASAQLTEAAELLAKHINTAIPTANIKAIPDTQLSDTEYEILIGEARGLASVLPEEKNYCAMLDGKQLRLCGKDERETLNAINYLKLYGFLKGYFVISDVLNYASADAAYSVLTQSPEKYYYYEDVYTPTLIYTFNTSVDESASRISVGGIDVTPYAVWSDGSVTLSGYTVPAGDHTVLVGLADAEGDISIFETTFSCGDGSVMHLYSGEVHAHTTSSDGSGTVEEAYAYARDVAKLDFFSVTDHSDSFGNEEYQNRHIPNADSYNDPGKFVALYGYEQTYCHKTGYYGHLNTINYGSLTLPNTPLEKYYQIMAQDPNAIVMFNHPGYRWGNFLEYGSYSEEHDSAVDLAEIKGSGYNSEYALALTKGWHVSPMYNEDNHDPNWGNAYEYCGYALAPALTRQNIIDAFNKNRTYTTTDKSLKIYYKINDEWMGARLDNPAKLKFSVQLSTEKPQGLGKVSIVAEDNIIVAFKQLGGTKEFTWEFELDPHYDYYYVKVESGKTWCVTAPIWIENREHITVSALDQQLIVGSSGANDYRISAKITNSTDKPMTDVKVNFYSSVIGGYIEEAVRYDKVVDIGTIAPGETVTAQADLKYIISRPKIYAVATAEQNGESYGAVKYMEISNIYFSEIHPFTVTNNTVMDAFEFIELYNNSDSEIDLSKFTMQYYSRAGAKAADLQANTWKLNGKIQPHSTLVLWFVPESNKLTVADFNAHYNVSLTEGSDIVKIVGKALAHTNSVQLEILSGKTVVARAWYNYNRDLNVIPNRSIIYNYPTDHTFTAKVHKDRIAPTPGTLAKGQMPETITK